MTNQNRLLLATISVFIGMSCLTLPATHGAKVYKWVDDDGKVTYRDKPPPAKSGGKFEVKEINPDHNVIQTTPRAIKPGSTRQPKQHYSDPGISDEKKADNSESEKQRRAILIEAERAIQEAAKAPPEIPVPPPPAGP